MLTVKFWRRRKHKYGGKNDIVLMLRQVYRVAGALAANASKEAIGNLDTTELEAFLLHVESVLKALTTQDEWTCTGVFKGCDSVMIGALTQLIYRGVADTFVEEKYCTLVRLAGTPEDEPRTDLHVEVGTPPWRVGKPSEGRPSSGWSMSAWYRVTKSGPEEPSTARATRARPLSHSLAVQLQQAQNL
jgi:hypothetical protein